MTVIEADAVLDAGGADFGNGLLLKLHAALDSLADEAVLEVRDAASSVPEDLAAWCVLTGNTLVGPLLVRKGAIEAEDDVPPLGTRLWLYSNFDCNLACTYCCAESSPRAVARRLPVDVVRSAVREFAAEGGSEVFVTGGEPFMHPELGDIAEAVIEHLPLTILTNGMIYQRGTRRATLEALDRERVTLQISLDSATPALHDRSRGAGSFARALAGIELARSLGFRVRVAATIDPADADEIGGLRELLTSEGIRDGDLVVRRVARQGFAEGGVVLTREDLAPEPTVAADGVWWHPVGVTDPTFKVRDSPLPIRAALDEIARILGEAETERDHIRHAFRCA
ncbi:radical SAM protein [Sinomonas sp. ASV322]|uniref:Rv1681 family radical SAM protein n=1 Tax=Sinomonas sp. ASV322 TaxID=3041920 RepID=UPI0027DDEEC2|nr:radical SAM protein [Sinomonas sp. ASV322]MDQ4503514.1 radical SAM protein [Sinomonas sp. ASV322]